jgi:hypothetical protein
VQLRKKGIGRKSGLISEEPEQWIIGLRRSGFEV